MTMDFLADYTAAVSDRDLCAIMAGICKGGGFTPTTDSLLPASRILESVCKDLLIKMQRRYSSSKRQLRLVVYSDATIANAFAVWTMPQNDWIVLTTGLLRELYDGSQRLGAIIGEAYTDSQLAVSLHHGVGKTDLSMTELGVVLMLRNSDQFERAAA
jgi:hypothetical protein